MTVEEYESLERQTPYTFNCLECGKEVTLKKSNSLKERESQKLFLCRACKLKKTNLERYGVTSYAKTQESKEKSKATCLKKFGKEYAMQSEEVLERQKQTCFQRYGVTNPMQVEDFQIKQLEKLDQKELQIKREQTFRERYGVTNPMQVQTFLEKAKQTNLERYGFACNFEDPEVNRKGIESSQSEESKSKRKQTNIERYGSENPMQNLLVQESQKKTLLEHFGVTNPMLSKEIQSKVKQNWEEKSKEEKLEIRRKSRLFWANLTDEEKLEIRRKSTKHYVSLDGETFDSKWELAYYEYCLEKNYIVKREPVALVYEYLGEKHTYYPDFEVNGQLIEIKGNHLKDEDGKWICPFKHKLKSQDFMNRLYEAKRQCALKNNVKVLYEEDLITLGVKLN